MRVWILFQDYYEDRTTIGVYSDPEVAKVKGIEDWKARAGWRRGLEVAEWKATVSIPGFPEKFITVVHNDGHREATLHIEEWLVA